VIINRHQLRKAIHYNFTDYFRYLKAKKSLQTDILPVLVYTMGKVASKSIAQSLKSHFKNSVYHIHSLNKAKIEKVNADCFKKGIYPDGRTKGGLIYKYKVLPKKSVKIITTIREPIARNLSAFFEVFEYHTGSNVKDWKGDVNDLQQFFQTEFDHNYALNWFDDEYKMMLGIDIYQQKFDSTLKYKIIKNENLDILLFRIDISDNEKENLIKDFLGLNNFKLTNKNIGQKKDYNKLYMNLKENIKLSSTYIDEMLDSKFTNHFYSMSEILELKKKYYN